MFEFYGNVINIYTDASMVMKGEEFYTCCATIAVLGNNIYNPLKYDYRIFKATNNFGEVYGVLMAVEMAIQMKRVFPYATFNIFSDSQISVAGVKEWCFTWFKRMREDGVFFSSEFKPVANQEIFKKIIWLIVTYNIHINFYHVRGHIDKIGFRKAMQGFESSNGFPITLDIMRSIAYMNNQVDNMSRNKLKAANLDEYESYPLFYSYIIPPQKSYMRNYRKHINLRGN